MIPERIKMLIKTGRIIDTAAREACRSVGKGLLVLSGKAGTGKTVAAAEWSTTFISSSQLARWKRYEDKEMRELLEANRLVVDDLGTEFMDEKGNFMVVLDEVVNERYANMRPMVITTNLNATDFRDRYGKRVIDRLRERGRFLELATESMRVKADDEELEAAYRVIVDAEQAEKRKAERPWYADLPEEEVRRIFTPAGEEYRNSAPGTFGTTRPYEPMGAAETAARKAEIVRQLEQWTRDNPDAAKGASDGNKERREVQAGERQNHPDQQSGEGGVRDGDMQDGPVLGLPGPDGF